MMSIYLSLGTNLGDREQHLQQAVFELEKEPGNHILNVSSIYETEPVGYADQSWFLNLVLSLKTILNPYELLRHVKNVEKAVGREVTFKWGPRVIDVDILSYNDEIIHSNNLIIPHPEMHLRRFVLLPLSEIAPYFIHPVKKLSISQMLDQCPGARANWYANFKR